MAVVIVSFDCYVNSASRFLRVCCESSTKQTAAVVVLPHYKYHLRLSV